MGKLLLLKQLAYTAVTGLHLRPQHTRSALSEKTLVSRVARARKNPHCSARRPRVNTHVKRNSEIQKLEIVKRLSAPRDVPSETTLGCQSRPTVRARPSPHCSARRPRVRRPSNRPRWAIDGPRCAARTGP